MKENIIQNLKEEIGVLKLEIRENEISIRKYEKKVERENNKIQKKLHFETEEEAQESYGYGEITEEEYNLFIDKLEDIASKTSIDKMFLNHLKKIKGQNMKDLKYLKDELFKEELVEIART